MQPRRWGLCVGFAAALAAAGAVRGAPSAPAAAAPCIARNATCSPADLLQDLFARVQTQGLFADSKTFADAVPRQSPAAILAEYHAARPATRQALADFVREHFKIPAAATPPPIRPKSALPLRAHIAALWPHLIRKPTPPARFSSRLPFPFTYVVPGGRFREIYYWDTYFTLLGLSDGDHSAVVQSMVAGFADLIHRYGHVPNGTRTYYLSRSQPPFFYRMVALLNPQDPAAAYARYLPALRQEYAYWMKGADDLKPNHASRNVVMLADGAVLNRYWDSRDTPRDESYREDVALARQSGRPRAQLYRDLRAAAESGWDFSSRWLADGRNLSTIETTAIVPVDLNSLLYGLERAIADGCARHNDATCARNFSQLAARRKVAMNKYLWMASADAYFDYDWRHAHSMRRLSAATLYPLFVGAADATQAAAVAQAVRSRLLAPGGLVTTRVRTGQQWDSPYGWAPLQWIAVCGLNAYGDRQLAGQIARRWLRTVEIVYRAQGKLVEKYDVEMPGPGGGGEYPLQDGFGWTNGVTAALLDLGYGDAQAGSSNNEGLAQRHLQHAGTVH
ncbi:MAG: alpha,alpha-trehalase TreF [Gammaproteobacteria bacterium]|nr:alpha,alpha-trehalase TreF [Gammaproteobacteria bacterium]